MTTIIGVKIKQAHEKSTKLSGNVMEVSTILGTSIRPKTSELLGILDKCGKRLFGLLLVGR